MPALFPACPRPPPAGAAFSLVEVILALMVISVGILAILGLFPLGLEQNNRAIANSQMALFAQEVLNGLRAAADEDWDHLESAQLPVAAGEYFKSMPAVTNTFMGIRLLVYTNDSSLNIVNHALRYRLAITNRGDRIKTATLSLWSGQFGATSVPSVFYGEFFKLKD